MRGFYAADGNAAESGADKGNVWQCRFSPNRAGQWNYEASLKRGDWIAINDDPNAGEKIELSNARGSFQVTQWPAATTDEPPATRDFRRQGRLSTGGGHYFKFSDSGKYWLKAGANSPENLLAYVDFDGTYRMAANDREGEAKATKQLHRFSPHAADWTEGNPSWQHGKGKSLIGAINYLASTGMNSIYFLTMNITGDGKDVWPYAAPDDFTRFDCSKLDQWEIVFEHMQRRGMLMHVITQETENERLLDDGDTGNHRRLYYRELISRFAHHPAIVWNLGEENGPASFSPNGQTTAQEKAMADYIAQHDPYHNTVVIHTHSTAHGQDEILTPLLGHQSLAGVSLQVDNPKRVHADVKKWREKSVAAKRPWLITMDEIGPADYGAPPDEVDPSQDKMRGDVLWGSLLAGAGGVEWYFGYKLAHNDLEAEDWRSRQELWRQSHLAIEFFHEHLPFWEMEPADDLVDGGQAYCFADPGNVYAIYRAAGQADAALTLDLSNQTGEYRVDWFDPRAGGVLQPGSVELLTGGKKIAIGMPPRQADTDWVALVGKQDVGGTRQAAVNEQAQPQSATPQETNDENWRPLLTHSLDGWEVFTGIPHKSTSIPGFPESN